MTQAGRYRNLDLALDELARRSLPALRYLDIGTYDGVRAAQLLRRWYAETGRPWHYYGFDLFEHLTPEKAKQELAKSRLPPPLVEVHKRLSAVPGKAHLALFAGDTRELLPRMVPNFPAMDLIFLDGGHSLETVRSDWEAIQPLMRPGHTVVLLDDYYENRDDVGCRRLVDQLRRPPQSRYSIELLEPVDRYDHTRLTIRMVKIALKN